MRLTCPGCGAQASLEAWLADTAARDLVAIAAALPGDVGPLAVRYLGLWRAPARGLAWDRAARILGELAAAVASGQVERRGRTHMAPPAAWRSGLEQMLTGRERLTLPLRSHGYLFEIVADLAARTEAAAERARIQATRPLHPSHLPAGPGATGPQPVGAVVERISERRGPPPGWREQALGARKQEGDGDE